MCYNGDIKKGRYGIVKFWKKIVCAALALGLMLSFAGCNKEVKDWNYIAEKGEMIIGYTVYMPFAETDAAGGFDIELAKMVAEKLGVKAKFQIIQDWNNKVAELNGLTIDVIWNAMTISDDLKKVIDISDPYIENQQVVVVPKGKSADFSEKASLTGKKVAVENGSAGEKTLDALGINVNKIEVNPMSMVMNEVKSGTSDCGIMDRLQFDYYCSIESNGYKDSLEIAESIQFDMEVFGIGVRKGATETMAKITGAINELKESGDLLKLAEKYGLADVLIWGEEAA